MAPMDDRSDPLAEQEMPRARLALLLEHSSRLDDDREPWRVLSPLSEVLLLLTCATIASCDDFEDIAAWGEHHLDVLRRLAPFHFGIPCQHWLRTLVNRVDPILFGRCFEDGIRALWPGRHELIAIDGRTARRTHDKGKGLKALHTLSAAGLPSLIEAFRQSGAAAVIDREVTIKQRKRGLRASEMVESLLALWAGGGERAEDLDRFREDKALALLLGHALPAAQTARDLLAQFQADDLPLLHAGKSTVPAESTPLQGLAKANAELVLDLQCRRPVRTATLDVDATIIPCDKRAAKRSYDGQRGYQPVLVL